MKSRRAFPNESFSVLSSSSSIKESFSSVFSDSSLPFTFAALRRIALASSTLPLLRFHRTDSGTSHISSNKSYESSDDSVVDRNFVSSNDGESSDTSEVSAFGLTLGEVFGFYRLKSRTVTG
ncbi:unnamed protein product [Acanthoscelides obtectus]|uniref:Uncharacterized protein n=1 Tax=Acanthoscelides obtectus TaxID=200917 RepID=A0A9P0PSL1_ACAOB|nr:unnamed protein product [Acanthoscelides obtectus]CAK1679841.1 hypothetical protein AOBTE_LOCUS32442 [Acanthoscelides obtectus]